VSRLRFLALAAVLLPTLLPTVALATEVKGVLSSNTTWTAAGNPYNVTGDLKIPRYVTLTLEPGVQVVFSATDSLATGQNTAEVEFTVDGTLLSQGTSDAPVTITATGADGTVVYGTVTADYTHFIGGSDPYSHIQGTSTFRNSTFRDSPGACVGVHGGTFAFSHGTITNCYSALNTYAGSTRLSHSVVTGNGDTTHFALNLRSDTTVEHSTLTGNKYGAVNVLAFTEMATGSITLIDNIITSNGSFGVIFPPYDTIPYTAHHNLVWGHTTNSKGNFSLGFGTVVANPLFVSASNVRITENSPARMAASDGTDLGAFAYAGDPTTSLQGYIHTDKTLSGANTLAGDLTVRPGAKLTLEPGASLTFPATDGMAAGTDRAEAELIVQGTLLSQGTSASPVSITSTGAYGTRVLAGGSLTAEFTTFTGGDFTLASSGTGTLTRSTVQGGTTECVRVSGGTFTFTQGTLTGCPSALIASGGTTHVSHSLVKASGNATSSLYALHLGAPTTLAHNTITGNSYGAVRVTSFSTGSIDISDNIITSNGGYGLMFPGFSTPARSVHHNLVWGHQNVDYDIYVEPGEGPVSGNPLFVSTSDFHLTENSPARMVASDGTDLGAFPYKGDPTPTLQGILYTSRTLSGANTLAGDLTVRPGVTLTLTPGASLTFSTTDGMRAGLNTGETELIVQGTLLSQGTSASPISFTATNAYGTRVLAGGSATVDFTTFTGGLLALSSSGTTTVTHSTVQGTATTITDCMRVEGGTFSFTRGTLTGCRSALVTTGGTTHLGYSLVKASGSSSVPIPALKLGAPTTLVHNTLANNIYGGVQVTHFSTGAVTVSDNIIASNMLFGLSFDNATTPTRSVHHNLVWGHSDSDVKNVEPGADTVVANPLLVSTTNFRPTENSPARMAASDGTDLGAFAYAGDPTATLQGILYTNKTLSGAQSVAGDLTVRPGITLTLAPGASLTFAATDGMRAGANTNEVELIVQGTLLSQGTSASPISLNATGAYGTRVLAGGSTHLDFTTLSGGLFTLTSSGTTTAHNSTVQGGTTECVRVDDGTFTFSSGTLTGCPIALNTLGGTTHVSHTLVKASGNATSSLYALKLGAPTTLVHNTLTGNSHGAVNVTSFSPGAVTLYDNIITSNGTSGLFFDNATTPTRSMHHNLLWGHTTNANVALSTDSLVANPLFVSSTNARITENSPARMAASDGMDLGAFAYAGDPTALLQGYLHTNKTLSGAHTVVGDLTVRPGVTLTLAPGTSLTFASTDGMGSGQATTSTEFIVQGTLLSQGTSASPVSITSTGAYGTHVLAGGSATVDFTTFTGGDYVLTSSGTTSLTSSTVQGTTTTPTQCVHVHGGTFTFTRGTLRACRTALYNSGGTSHLSYSVVTNNGTTSSGTTSSAALYLSAQTTLVHNTLVANLQGGVYVSAYAKGPITLSDNIIASNNGPWLTFGDSIEPARTLRNNLVWGNANDTSYQNYTGYNPLFVSSTNFRITENSPARMAASDGTDQGAFAYAGDPTTPLQGFLYADKTLSSATTLGGDLFVRPGVKLTLAPGASLTLPATDGMAAGTDKAKAELVVQGTLLSQGTSASPVSITATGAYGTRVEAGGNATLDSTTLTGGLYALTNSGTTSLTRSTAQGSTEACVRVDAGTLTFTQGTLTGCSVALQTYGGTSQVSYSLVKASGNLNYSLYALQLGAPTTLAHNTLTGNKYGAVRVTSFSTGAANIYDNIITSNGTYGVSFSSATSPARSVHHNDVWSHTTDYNNVTAGTGSLAVNPLFVSSTNYTLQEGSPCRDKASDGTDLGAFPYVLIVPSRVVVSPASTSLAVKGTQAFTATAYDAANNPLPNRPVKWSASSAAGTIDAAGKFTAGCTPGTYAGAVTATVDGTSGTANVTLTLGATANIPLSPAATTVAIRGTQQFTASAQDACGNALPGAIAWAVPNGGGTVSSTGLFTAGTTTGTFTVRATHGTLSTTANVTVIGGPLASLAVTPSSRTLPIRGVEQFTAVGRDSAGNIVPVTPTWTVVNGGGTIDVDGTFIAGTTPGTYANTVRATATGISGHASVTVQAGPLARLDVTPAASTLSIRETQQFTVKGSDSAGNPVAVSSPMWSVVKGGGTIDANGLFTAGTTSGAYEGTVRVTSNGVEAFASVQVQPGPLASIVVAPSPVRLPLEGSKAFTATGKDSAGNTVPTSVTWSVVNGGGSIDASGLFTAGTTPGTYTHTVQATSGEVSGFVTVTVYEAGPLATLEVTPGSITLPLQGTQRFSVTGSDAAGNPVPVSVTWSVVDGGTIDASGLFTAGTKAGTYAVRATAEGITGTASVTVTAGGLHHVVLSPQNPTVAVESTLTFTAKAFDVFDNELAQLTPTWEVVKGGGTIDASGVFTAGNASGTFADTVKVTMGGQSAITSVTVATDYDDDGLPDVWEVANGFDPTKPGEAQLDTDGDMLTNALELQAGTHPRDADTDDDGVLDGRELKPTEDADGDGRPNARDADSDNDGLADGTEMAVTTAHADTDVSKGFFVADADPTTSTGPLTADTDGDGRKDGEEDANRNGGVDSGETDSNTSETFCVAKPDCGGGQTCGGNGVCVAEGDKPQPTPKPEGGGCSGSGAGTSVSSLLLLALLGLVARRGGRSA